MSEYQVKADLADRADLSQVVNEAEYGGPRRSELLQMALGLDEDEIHVYSTGGYQGTMTFTVVVDDLLWIIKDSYGSCSYCDGLLACVGEDEYRNYAESMMNNAYAFESKNDAVRFLHDEDDELGWGWDRVKNGTIEVLEEVDDPKDRLSSANAEPSHEVNY